MEIKCIMVGMGDILITEIQELDAEIGDPDCKLVKPLKFLSIDNMTPCSQTNARWNEGAAPRCRTQSEQHHSLINFAHLDGA